ncbi:hypothetical protein Taro_033930 [Colocasia esculenta]|uniref:Uncharacterized protein n=1 Tax=Colocasia esculenta TaxID=4460 RepID=A0A843WDZ5_COLES|nr:hypothetical protein [Colocasia esculenta]
MFMELETKLMSITCSQARRMDVVWGETAGVEGQLWLLCPILFILQIFEAYVGVKLLLNALEGLVPEWQVVVCGILLVLMAVGNFANTVQTLMAKSRFKAKMKRKEDSGSAWSDVCGSNEQSLESHCSRKDAFYKEGNKFKSQYV